MSLESIVDKRHGIGYGESIAVQEHQEVRLRSRTANISGEKVELARMRANCRNYFVKVLSILL
jgi:hypothetical protein